jgi:hypothetical protein
VGDAHPPATAARGQCRHSPSCVNEVLQWCYSDVAVMFRSDASKLLPLHKRYFLTPKPLLSDSIRHYLTIVSQGLLLIASRLMRTKTDTCIHIDKYTGIDIGTHTETKTITQK